MKPRIRFLLAVLACSGPVGAAVRAAEFDRLGEQIARLLADARTKFPASLGFRDLEALPSVLRDSRSALLLVKTDQGNLARLLVAPAFRKRPVPDPAGKPATPGDPGPVLVPLLLIEHFEVFEGGRPSARIARGRDLMLFPGFQLDLDTGQVVPPGLGGDVEFSAPGRDDGRLAALGSVQIGTLTGAPTLSATSPGQPPDGRAVRPSDLGGRFRLAADGRWGGLLELAIDASGSVAGRFHSGSTGSDYPVTGKVDAEVPSKLRFTVEFPRARQEYQGLLWTEGKQVICGTGTMLGREFGFVAVREGASVNLSEDAGIEPLLQGGRPDPAGKWLTVGIESVADRYILGKTSRSGLELTEALIAELRSDPKAGVVLQVSDTETFARLRQSIDIVRAAGITNIRLSAAGNRP